MIASGIGLADIERFLAAPAAAVIDRFGLIRPLPSRDQARR